MTSVSHSILTNGVLRSHFSGLVGGAKGGDGQLIDGLLVSPHGQPLGLLNY